MASIERELSQVTQVSQAADSAPKILFVFRIVNNKSMRTAAQTFLMFIVYVVVSASVMKGLEPDWTTIDAAYFSMATMSTVVRDWRRQTWAFLIC